MSERIKTKEVNIIKDKKQVSVRIPANMVNEFNINTKQDNFIWVMKTEKKSMSLQGVFVKGGLNKRKS